MQADQAKQILKTLFVAFPQLGQWLRKTPTPNETYDVWVATLCRCEYGDCSVVLDKLSTGEIPLPDGYDWQRLPILLKREANEIRSARDEKARMERLSEQADRSKTSTDARFTRCMRVSSAMGTCVKYRAMTETDNRRRLVELLDWYRAGGEEPKWIAEVVDRAVQSRAKP